LPTATVALVLSLLCGTAALDMLDDVTSVAGASKDTNANVIPGKPRAEDITSAGATLTWLAPAAQLVLEDGHKRISGYRIRIHAATDGKSVKTQSVNGSSTTNTLVTGLQPKTEYTASVATITTDSGDIVGPSAKFETKASVPEGMSALSVSDVNWETATLHWKTPNDHGSEITGYHISVQIGGGGDYSPLVQHKMIIESTDSKRTSMKLVGLESATTLRFKVAAINKLGTGPSSAPSKVIRTKTAQEPSAPKITAVKHATSKGVTVHWAPAEERGSRITRYLVYRQSKLEGHFDEIMDIAVSEVLKTASGYSQRISKLDPGTKYAFKVAAANGIGIGAASNSSEPVQTTATVADAPAKPHISNVKADSVYLSWKPPKKNNGSPVTGYRITVQEGGSGGFVELVRDTKSLSTFKQIENLKQGGVSYEFKVQAVTMVGLGKQSPASSIAVTHYNDALATKQAVLDSEAVRSIQDVHDRVSIQKAATVAEKHKALLAKEAKRHARFREQQEKTRADRCETGLANQKVLFGRQLNACHNLLTREVAAQKRLSTERLQAEENMSRKQLLEAEGMVTFLKQRRAALETKVTILENKSEQQLAKLVMMQNEGCKLGIKTWCKPEGGGT